MITSNALRPGWVLSTSVVIIYNKITHEQYLFSDVFNLYCKTSVKIKYINLYMSKDYRNNNNLIIINNLKFVLV